MRLPNTAIRKLTFYTVDSDGLATAPDSSPAATLIAWQPDGTARSHANSVTIIDSGDGEHLLSCPLAGLSDGDQWEIIIEAVIDGETYYGRDAGVIDQTTAAAKSVVDNIASGTTVVRAVDGSGNAIAPASDVADIKAKTDNLPDEPASKDDVQVTVQPTTLDSTAVDAIRDGLATSEQVSQITDKLPSSDYLAGSDSEDGAVAGIGGNGDGDTPVDHNWAGSFTVNGGDPQEGGDDSLLITSSQGAVDGATIRAYVADDYDAGTRTVNAQTSTGSDGRWVAPLMLDPGDYVIVISKPGVMVTTLIRLTVE